jgi:Pectate lyase superfamily protein
MVGRRFKGPTGLRSNLYIVGLAESGFGKDTTIRASAALADSTSWGDKVSEWLFMDQIRSLPGLTNKLRKSPTAVIIQDEFGRFLADHTGRNVATHRAEITTALMELTGAPSGFWGGQEKAAGNIARIIQPCFTIHGVSTPSTFWAALSSGNISEGLLGRLVVIDVGSADPVKVRRPVGSIEDIPVGLSEQVAGLLGLSAGKYTGPFFALNAKSDEKPHPIMTAEWGEGVDDLFEEFDDRIRAMKKAVDPQYRPILNRVGENAARLALIVAVGCDPKEPVITTEIQEWANAVVEHSLGVILRGANDHIRDFDVGDTNQSVALQAAIDSAAAYRKAVYIPAGDYNMYSAVTMTSQFEIEGDGDGASTISTIDLSGPLFIVKTIGAPITVGGMRNFNARAYYSSPSVPAGIFLEYQNGTLDYIQDLKC